MVNRQEQRFGYRVGALLEKAGFTMVYVPMSRFRTQLIDAFAIRGNMVVPIEFKGKQSKYKKQWNSQQETMQKNVFGTSGTSFIRVTQGNRRGEVTIDVISLGKGLVPDVVDEAVTIIMDGNR